MDIFTMPVHPVCAILPMMPDDELDDLAASIKATGLRDPIVVQDGVLVDGKCRREACKRAGVTPRVVEFNGTDATAFIISMNLMRQSLSKAQRAMAVARLYPELVVADGPLEGTELVPVNGSRRHRSLEKGGYLRKARTVLQYVPETAKDVLAGTLPLSAAYARAVAVREDINSAVTRMARLREHDSDLADLVIEGRMSLVEAESAYETQQEDIRRRQDAAQNILDKLERVLRVLGEGKRRAALVEDLRLHEDDRNRARRLITQWIKDLTGTHEALE